MKIIVATVKQLNRKMKCLKLRKLLLNLNSTEQKIKIQIENIIIKYFTQLKNILRIVASKEKYKLHLYFHLSLTGFLQIFFEQCKNNNEEFLSLFLNSKGIMLILNVLQRITLSVFYHFRNLHR